MDNEIIRIKYFNKILDEACLKISSKYKLDLKKIQDKIHELYFYFLFTVNWYDKNIDPIIINPELLDNNRLNKFFNNRDISIDFINLLKSYYKKFIAKLNNNKPKYKLEKTETKNTIILSYGKNKIIIPNFLFEKLKKQYNGNNLYEDIFILFLRYKGFRIYDNNLGLAVLPKFKENLLKKYSIDFELFASPFNNYFPRFCSLFYDIDKYFGSVGSANFYIPKQNEVIFSNPPFINFIMTKITIKYIEYINKYNCIIITTIPYWKDMKSIEILKMHNFISNEEIKDIKYFNYVTNKEVSIKTKSYILTLNKQN